MSIQFVEKTRSCFLITEDDTIYILDNEIYYNQLELFSPLKELYSGIKHLSPNQAKLKMKEYYDNFK